MKTDFVRMSFVLLVCAAAVGPAPGQCGPGGCSSVTTAPLAAESGDRWVRSPIENDGHRYYLYRDGIQVGGWDMVGRYYRPLQMDGSWGGVCRPPIAPPGCTCGDCVCPDCDCAAKRARLRETVPDWRTHGVDESRFKHKPGGCYSINGVCCCDKFASGDMKLEDDSGKLWLVVIGADADRQRLLDDLSSPALADLKSRVRAWSVPPDHFSLMDRDTNQPMFDNRGKPSWYLMTPEGGVLSEQVSYNGADDLRKADPNRKPPDEPKKPDVRSTPLPSASTQAQALALVAGAGVLLYLLRKPQSKG